MMINQINYPNTLHRFYYINSQEMIIICNTHFYIIDGEFKPKSK